MPSTRKKHAPHVPYVSQNQLTIAGFETPFSQNLDKNNRWVRLADRIPWDELAGIYMRRFTIKSTGRPPLNPRIVLGSIIIKTCKTIRNAVGKQLRYLRRNLASIDQMLDRRQIFPLEFKDQRYLMVIHTLYQQQLEMYEEKKHSVADRIVSLHQPHV